MRHTCSKEMSSHETYAFEGDVDSWDIRARRRCRFMRHTCSKEMSIHGTSFCSLSIGLVYDKASFWSTSTRLHSAISQKAILDFFLFSYQLINFLEMKGCDVTYMKYSSPPWCLIVITLCSKAFPRNETVLCTEETGFVRLDSRPKSGKRRNRFWSPRFQNKVRETEKPVLFA
jgi:hypothetical protein